MSKPTPLTVIGLMSGTSVDSIDAACVSIEMTQNPLQLSQFHVLETETLDFKPAVREKLLQLMSSGTTSLETICQLNFEVGNLLGQAALALIQKLQKQQVTIDLIASHGQTLYHIPPSESTPGSTLQIGHPALIAEITGIEVVADFRPSDMAAGGQGAPLVPFADQLLFQDAKIARAVQNIGGIANLTALPPVGHTATAPMAFDTGPGNMIIDALMEALFQQPYDVNGQMAQQGQMYQPMLDAMLAHPYFMLPPPKTTGREVFGKQYALRLLEQWKSKLEPQDIVATATYFTAFTIADAYSRFVLPRIPIEEVVVGGGGVLNSTLMRFLETELGKYGIGLKRHEDFDIDSKYKEAIAFALLGYARKMGISNNIPTCTGAHHSVVMGGIWMPR